MSLIHLHCAGCKRFPAQIQEYIDRAALENMASADEYVAQEEGTLDRETGAFLCTACYIQFGMPTSPTGWTATPSNLIALGIT